MRAPGAASARARPASRRHLGSTYRLQLNGMGFAAAAELVPFLADLGVETVYLSPVTRARASSTHGYDVVDPTQLDPQLGGREGFDALLETVGRLDLGLLLDIVPNHMAATAENPFFADVLRHGRESSYGTWFDVYWDEQDGKVLLPVLGDRLEHVIARDELTLLAEGDPAVGLTGPALGYFDHRFPLAPDTDLGAGIESVLQRQHFRLADWRVANESVNYRRFFDINELIGVRQEDPDVFRATHELVLGLLADPRVRGVRIDHIDGLRDPAGYLETLRAATAHLDPPPVILVEKILEADEELADWPVEGTTGYEFAAAVTGLFIEPAGAKRMVDATSRATGDDRGFAERAVGAKRRVVDALFGHEVSRVSRLVGEASASVGAHDEAAVRDAVAALTAALEVYRTYRRPGDPAGEDDLGRIDRAAHAARATLTGPAVSALDAVVDVVSGDLTSDDPAWPAVAAWQQFSGPVAAKGVEDTALYDSGGLLAAADVGADVDRPDRTPEQFHDFVSRRAERTPLAMNTTSTHDSKRGMDVRCRLAVLSEVPEDWESAVAALEEAVASVGLAAPEPAMRRYLYETAVGAWPMEGDRGRFAERLRDHSVKAAREAKRQTSWTDPDPAYEERLGGFASWLASDPRPVEALRSVVSAIESAGATNALAAVVLKTMAPGVPDVYQGDDAWSLTLVDPDNREPLDAETHRRLLAAIPAGDNTDIAASTETGELLTSWRDGRLKQHVLRQALGARRALPELFARGSYEPLTATGAQAERVVAFARHDRDNWAVAVVARLVYAHAGTDGFALGECWGDTMLGLAPQCPARLIDRLSGRVIEVADGVIPMARLLESLPVALLTST